ncbi:response regulator transcription factor [Oceanispirochaeta crateris]|uniref:Response regulator transcription factor n=1 Tax=Oceanispirochaeta crateris TaxID=2518645 RepID=A0A5C1QHA6_9SPIO|nr:response regulator transcription factor [Oceanispirochaeta crateris]QEN06718.1 response regulator transcription factor [Oceanispirochaeta crateris]
MDKTRIIIVDDQLLFAESLKTVLETRSRNIEVIDIAINGKEAVKMAGIHAPDLILMDIRMPEMNGVEAVKIIKEKTPDIKIIMLTTFDDDQYIYNALNNGADGYLLKNTPPEKLISSIEAARNGLVLISPNIIKHLAEDSVKQTVIHEKPAWFDELSKREKQVLKLLSNGLNNLEIAEELFIAEQTVKNHVSLIYAKLGTHDRLKVIRISKNHI